MHPAITTSTSTTTIIINSILLYYFYYITITTRFKKDKNNLRHIFNEVTDKQTKQKQKL